MKKIIALILSALTAFAFVACGEKETKKPAPETAQTGETGQTQTSQTAEKPVLGDPNIVHPDLTNGTLYTLREACDKNLLTQEELMSAAYYSVGDLIVFTDGTVAYSAEACYEYEYVVEEEWVNIKKLPFAPSEESAVQPEGLEDVIRNKFFDKHKDKLEGDEELIDFINIHTFLGAYEKKYIVQINQPFFMEGAGSKWYFSNYSGLAFHCGDLELLVYVLN